MLNRANEGATFTLTEIAEAFGISRTLVWKIERDAVAKIREALADDLYVIEWIDTTKEAPPSPAS